MAWRNHSLEFWFQYFRGFRFTGGQNFHFSHWLCWSSLTLLPLPCTTVQPVILGCKTTYTPRVRKRTHHTLVHFFSKYCTFKNSSTGTLCRKCKEICISHHTSSWLRADYIKLLQWKRCSFWPTHCSQARQQQIMRACTEENAAVVDKLILSQED